MSEGHIFPSISAVCLRRRVGPDSAARSASGGRSRRRSVKRALADHPARPCFLAFRVPPSQLGGKQPHVPVLSSPLPGGRPAGSSAPHLTDGLKAFSFLSFSSVVLGSGRGRKRAVCRERLRLQLRRKVGKGGKLLLVYPGGFKASAVVSPFTLPPPRSGGCLGSSVPTNFVGLFVCLFVTFSKFPVKQCVLC